LAMKVGQVTELRPDKGAIQVRVVYSTWLKGNAHQQVPAGLCVKVEGWNDRV
jgi:hypothetical protein